MLPCVLPNPSKKLYSQYLTASEITRNRMAKTFLVMLYTIPLCNILYRFILKVSIYRSPDQIFVRKYSIAQALNKPLQENVLEFDYAPLSLLCPGHPRVCNVILCICAC